MFLTDENQGLEWHVRYKIIKGICLGIKHLREGLKKPVWHLDLKPENILLDREMMPKIADFGLSRLIGDERKRKSMNNFGTCGYLPPEYVSLQLLSEAFDIFSLGVIITKIMIGNDGYNKFVDLPHRKLINQVRNNWKKRLQDTVRPGSLDAYCLQVKTCIDLAKRCLNKDRHQRPDIKKIVSTLDEAEIMIPLQMEQV
ncbi:hypothetical protein HU200_038216 [Digitaria exilis]|uniref:non-specific serine/threonine protein kinase n=1 Tax=Digitaria exilis TaxID=1010633 RepID=A0A835BKQ3_9POAL|nr:hypothetical protein HU200_038216 [Digitaria exilis]